MSTASAQHRDAPADWGVLSDLPGNPLMWVLIITELLVFGALLLGFAVARLLHPAMFQAGQASLNVALAGVNTLVLITSGYCAARAVQVRSTGVEKGVIPRLDESDSSGRGRPQGGRAHRCAGAKRERPATEGFGGRVRSPELGIKLSRPWLLAAMGLGGCFLAIKGVEYADKAVHGWGIETNTFFTLFYLLTGFHAMHVVAGIIVLGIVAWKNTVDNLETGAAFWHMIDLVWLLLFPLVYLLR